MLLTLLLTSVFICGTYEFPSSTSISEILNFRIKHDNDEDLITSIASLSFLTPSQDISKKSQEMLCSRVAAIYQKEHDLDIEHLFYLHRSSYYLNCKEIRLKEQTTQKLIHKVTEARSAYFLNELIELSQISSKLSLKLNTQELQKKFNDICRSKQEILELLFCSLSTHFVKNIDEIVKKMGDISQSKFNTASAVLYLQLVTNLSQSENIGKNVLKAIEIIDNSVSLDRDNIFHFSKLHSISSIKKNHVIKVYSRYLDSSESTQIQIVDYITGHALSHAITIAVETVQCDNKDALSSTNVISKQGNYEISVKQLFKECLLKLKISCSKSRILNDVHVIKFGKQIKPKFVDISITHSDVLDTTTPKTETVSDITEVGSHIIDLGRLILEFVLTKNNERVQPHQVFLRFSHQGSSFTTRYVPPVNSNKKYSFVVNVDTDANNTFKYTSGKYSMDLVIGDFDGTITVTNIGLVNIKFSSPSNLPQKHYDRAPQPELHNTPQNLYKKPYKILPLVFTCTIGASVFALFLLVFF